MSILTSTIYPESLYKAGATRCVFAYHGEQPSGEVQNLISGGPSAAKNTGFLDSELWGARPGWMTFGGTTKFVTAAASGTQLTMNGQSLIVTARIKKSLAAQVSATRYIAGNYTPGANTGGFVLQATTAGACGLTVTPVGGSASNIFAPSGTLTDGTTANEVSLVWVATRDGFGRVARDGVQVATTTIAGAANANLKGGFDLKIGGVAESFEMKHIAAYQVPLDLAGIPLELLFDWSYRHPGAVIPDWVFGL